MPLSYSRTWDDVTALFRAHAELVLAIAGVFLFLPAVASGFIIPDPEITATDMLGYVRQMVEHAQRYQLQTFLLSIPKAFGQLAILVLLLEPGRPTAGDALRRSMGLLISFLVLTLMVNISVGLGLLLLLIPGLYLFGRLLPASAAMASERIVNPLTSYARGWTIARGNGWRIFGILAIVVVVTWVLGNAIAAVTGIIASVAVTDEVARTIENLVQGLLAAATGIVLLLLTAAVYRQLATDAQTSVSLNKGI